MFSSAAEQKLRETIEAGNAEKKQALRELQLQKEEEQRQAVKSMHKQEQENTSKKLADQKNFYDQNIRILQSHLSEKKREIGRLEEKILQQIIEKENTRRELCDTRAEFDLFISRVRPFNDTESGFVLPPAKTIPAQ